jgi:hypothetical protein
MDGFRLAWVEMLILAAQSSPWRSRSRWRNQGINNITEVLLMGAVAVIQIVLFALAAADVPGLEIFRNTEFLSLTFINVAQTVVAFQINAATLMRTIASG